MPAATGEQRRHCRRRRRCHGRHGRCRSPGQRELRRIQAIVAQRCIEHQAVRRARNPDGGVWPVQLMPTAGQRWPECGRSSRWPGERHRPWRPWHGRRRRQLTPLFSRGAGISANATPASVNRPTAAGSSECGRYVRELCDGRRNKGAPRHRRHRWRSTPANFRALRRSSHSDG